MFRTWLSVGAIAVIYSFVVACTPVKDSDITLTHVENSLSNGADAARLEEAHKLWVEESGEYGDPYTAGKAAYDIAQLTRDPQWSNQAVAFLEQAREDMPEFALATAYLGSAHSLVARDYPLQGLWQVIPGPGFVRMYHVNEAESLLNAAVEQDPQNPVVRLIRAATVIGMPGILVDHDVALADFELLAEWEANPDVNSAHADVLRSAKWQRGFYSAYAETLAEQNETERATLYEGKLALLPEEEK